MLTPIDLLHPAQRDVLRFWPNEGAGAICLDNLSTLNGGVRKASSSHLMFLVHTLKDMFCVEKREDGYYWLTEYGQDMWAKVRSADEFAMAMVVQDCDGNAIGN